MYDSLTPQGVYSQAFNGPQVTQFGQAINLASNPAGAPLDTVNVRMVNFAPTAFSTSVTFKIYNLGQGGVVGSLLASVTKSIAVPAGSATWPHGVFNATFDVNSKHVVLPSTVVYGVTLNDLNNSGNDPAPVGSLNVALSPNVSSGTDVYPGDIFISSLQADAGGSALASNLGACTGAPTSVLSTFQGVPVSCANGYGGNAETVINSSWLGVDNTPAVEFATHG